MELILTIALTSVFLIGLLFVLSRGNAPSYRPTRADIVKLLQGVIDGTTTQYEWDLFIGYPILADPELEQIRRRCLGLIEGTDDHPPYPSGLGDYIFNKAGREQMVKVLEELKELIANEPFQKDF